MKRFILILPVLVLVFLAGCKIKEPGSPKWDVEITIAIADSAYSLSEIVDDSSEINYWVSPSGDSIPTGNWVSVGWDPTAEDSILYINYADTIERVENNDSLQVDSIQHTTQSFVGNRNVNAPGLESTFYLLTQMNPNLIPGVPYPTIPAIEFDSDPNDLEAYEEYDWVLLKSVVSPDTNEVTITITNYLPFPLEFLNVYLWAKQPNIMLYDAFFPDTLYPGDVRVSSDTLISNTEIDNEMYLILEGQTVTGYNVTVSDTHRIVIDVELSPLVVHSALAHIPVQIFDTLSVFQIESEDSIISATIKNAYIDYIITHNTQLYNQMIFTIPGFTDEYGETFADAFDLHPDSSYEQIRLDLSGYTLEADNNEVSVQVLATIYDSNDPIKYPDGPFVYVDADQYVQVDFQIYNDDDPVNNPEQKFTFSYFEAILQMQINEIEPTTLEIEDIPEGLDNLAAAEATLDLYLTSTIGIDVPLEIELYAYKKDTLRATLFESAILDSGTKANPNTSLIRFTDVTNIINVIPDKIEISGRYFVGGPDTIRLDEDNFNGAYVEGRYILYAPFGLEIEGLEGTTLEPEITTIDEGFENQLLEAELSLRLESHVPLSGSAKILACYDDSTKFDNPEDTTVVTFFDVQLPNAVLDANGYVFEPGDTTAIQILDEAKLEMFANASEERPLYIKTLLTIDPTDSVVKFNPNDYLKIGASAHLIVDVDFEEEEEGGN